MEKSLGTQDWAASVRDWERLGLTDLAFCVGSSLGFSDELRKQARGILSLGPQTLPHEPSAGCSPWSSSTAPGGVTRGHPYHNEG